ncbi:MAG: AAA family ATPase [Sphingomonadaceae bacterium]|nr:AAA family ATPase [Sphingomonadaceae bacterium]
MSGNVQALRPEPLPGSDGLRVLLIVEPSTPTAALGTGGWGKHRLTIDSRGLSGIPSAAPALRQAEAVIVEVDPEDAASLADFARFVRGQAGRVPVVAAVRNLTVAATRLALRSGAADVLPLHFTPDELDSAVAPTPGAPRPAAGPLPPKGKIVAVTGAIGGCGTTATAVQMGILWAASARVCLIDFDLQFGNAALYLDLGTQLGVADLLDAGARLDVDLLRNVAQLHASGLSVIAAPADILPLDAVSPEIVDKILALATQAYDIVLVDLPTAWTTWSMRVVEVADAALMVTALTVPGIHQARRQVEIIAANGFADRLRVVVNRVTHPMFGAIDLSETQTLLGRRIDFAVANDYPTVSTAIDRGKPLAAIKARSRVEKDLKAIVAGLVPALKAEAAA